MAMRYPVGIRSTGKCRQACTMTKNTARLESSTEEATRLCDGLVSIMALPALWTGGEPAHIASTLLDALLASLRLTFVVVRLNDPEGRPPIEMMRAAESLRGPARAEVSLASARLGLHGEIGIVVAGSQKVDFPADIDRLLLNVAANQAALALQQAHAVAERKRADETRRNAERESRLVVDNIPGLVALLSTDGDVQFVNRQILEYTGRTLEELKQWGTSDTVYPEDLPHVIQVFSQSIASGTPYEIVQRLRRSDGLYR
jgi:PAS domain S-box-containing protein